ncbi:MAG: hypothetical protein KDJ29_16075, partial [Hyphomicrobiales bacterium]|nr:hypothetical protein [Hyphomicrobiales bacterium]
KLAEFSRWGAVSVSSAAVNYMCYSAALLLSVSAGFDPRQPVLIMAASAAGSGIAAVATFLLSRRFVFRSSAAGELARP